MSTFQKGDRVRLKDRSKGDPEWWTLGVHEWLRGKVGTVTSLECEVWECLVIFEETPRKGGMYAFWEFQLELIEAQDESP